jgi:hypothetical protein
MSCDTSHEPRLVFPVEPALYRFSEAPDFHHFLYVEPDPAPLTLAEALKLILLIALTHGVLAVFLFGSFSGGFHFLF